jgi:hypothetical protein
MPRTNGKSFLVAAKCILECRRAFPLTGASSSIALSVQFRGSSSSRMVSTILPDARTGIRRLSKPWPLPPCSRASVKIPSFSASSLAPAKCRLGHLPRGELIEVLRDRVS